MARWNLFARDPGYALDGGLKLVAASAVRRHLGVDTATVTTTYTPAAWEKLGPSCGVALYREGKQEFSGQVVDREFTRDDAGNLAIEVQARGDVAGLAGRLAFPDPLLAADDQTVSDYWTFTGVASTAMQQLISDQAGPTCRTDRRIPGLVLGADPGVGVSRTWTGLFDKVLDLLTTMSVASGADLGVRVTAAPGQLTADIVAPRNLADTIRFSTDLSNIGSIRYRESAPTVTDAVAAGQGDLKARLRRHATTTDPLALQWAMQSWEYVDRRDTDDVTELATAASDDVAAGAATVSLALNLLDSDAATYGRDWDVGDRVTCYVGLPGQTKVATVSDVVREIRFDVDASGAETIRPAIGSYDAKASVPTPTQQQLARVGRSLANLIPRM